MFKRETNAFNKLKHDILLPSNTIKILATFVLYNNIYFCMISYYNSIKFFILDDNNIILYHILKTNNDNYYIFNNKKINLKIEINTIHIRYINNKIYGIINSDNKKVFLSINDKYLNLSIISILKQNFY